MKLGLWLVFLPLFLFGIWQDRLSIDYSKQLDNWSKLGTGLSVYEILDFASNYFFEYFAASLLIGLWLSLAFLTLLFHAENLIRGKLLSSNLNLFKRAIGVFLKRGLLAIIFSTILLVSIATLLQVLFAGSGIAQLSILLLQALFLIVPVLVAYSPKSPFEIVKSVINLSYLPKIRGIKWSMFVQLLSWQMLIFIILSLYTYLPSGLSDLYYLLTDSAGTQQVDLELQYLIGSFLACLGVCFGLYFLAILMTITYYRISTISQTLRAKA